MKKSIICIVSILMLAIFIINSTNSQIVSASYDFDNLSARNFVVVDSAGNILLEKNPNEKCEVASICKLMTTLITLENIHNGNLSLEDKLIASSYACDAEGSQAFLDVGGEYSIDNLLKSVIIASANDSAIVLAEGIAGNESAFVDMMNSRARELGMTNTKYANATGLPASEQYSTALDTSIILNEVSKYDVYRKYCEVWMDKLVHPSGRETELVNTNRLIKYYAYCETGKTGFTDEAGYCLSSTCSKDNFKLTCVVLGCDSSASRFKESVELYNYAYANFMQEKVLSAGDIVENDINVNKAKTNSIELVIEKDYYITQNKQNKSNYSVKFDLPDEIDAPIKMGDVVGKAMIVVDGNIIGEVNVVSSTNLDKQTYLDVLDKIIDRYGFIN